MFRIYLTEAIKNIKSRLMIAIVITLLFTFLIQISSYSLAWVTYHLVSNKTFNSGIINNEAYIEYSVYSIKKKAGTEYNHDIFISETIERDPEDPSKKTEIPLTEEEIAYNDAVIASFIALSDKLENIDGYVFSDKWWNYFISDKGKGYELSEQAAGRQNPVANSEAGYLFYTDLGYTVDEIDQFCTFNAVYIDKDSVMLEGFTYCDGEGFTEENLDFEYRISEDYTLPTIPIIMGYDFKDYFEIGDIIQNPDASYHVKKFKEGVKYPSMDQQYAKYVVVGFLIEDTTIERGPGVRRSIDNYIIIPRMLYTPQNFPDGSLKGQIKEFYQQLPNKHVYIEKENEIQIVEELSKALSEDTTVGQYYYLEKNTQVNKVYKQMYKDRMINYALIAGSTLTFCIAIIILIIINKFKSNIKDTAIHRLVGATVGDNVKAYVLEFAIYLLCSDILSHYVYIIYAFDPTSTVLMGFWMGIMIGDIPVRLMYPLMIAINILILAVVAIVAYICSSKIDTASIIKGKE